MDKPIDATHTGELNLGNISVPCHVLVDETRVISGRGMQNSLGFSRNASGLALGNFITSKLSPFLPEKTISKIENPIPFRRVGSGGSAPETNGYDATILIDICDAIIQANRAGVLPTENQQKHSIAAEVIVRSVAKVGIIALVDEATGYQDVRAKAVLATILEKFIAKELQLWTKTFPYEFYLEICRLKGWPVDFAIKRPSVVGHYTNDIVYDRLAPGVLKELRQRNPKLPEGGRKNRHHQWFTPDIGHPKLKEHLAAVTALMRASPNWGAFQRSLHRAFPKLNETIPMSLEADNGELA